MKLKKFIGPIIGLTVTICSIYILYSEFTNPKHELSKISLGDLWQKFANLDCKNWLLAASFTLIAYAALAAYDRIALQHLGKKISWIFIAICSFTTYALSHNIGASVFSGAAVRYRAYSLKGLVASEIAVLVAFCSFTFFLGTGLLSALVLFIFPDLFAPLKPFINDLFSSSITEGELANIAIGLACFFTLFIGFYIFGSWMQFKPLKLGKLQINYPKFPIVLQQLIIAPLEIIGAAGIIYAALPSHIEVNFLIVLGAFLLSFSLGLLSNAPGGGLGILEVCFINLIPQINPGDLLVALIIFRIFYLLIPLFISLFIVAFFEIYLYRQKNTPNKLR